MYTVMYIPAPLYSIIEIGHVVLQYILSPRVPRGGGEGVSSQQRRADLSCTCPHRRRCRRSGNRKL
ncbi:unnamed protein product [Staurois parvus]|uniref:Very-long-chain (3R)-3-hydroxyacyl-CoA dehydratase n=1 Tax=Staurois parvus TaxID=386267 RepID=A0ABN9BZ40_9NEOB|nr:unnamed protein product [Staurois parvus]